MTETSLSPPPAVLAEAPQRAPRGKAPRARRWVGRILPPLLLVVLPMWLVVLHVTVVTQVPLLDGVEHIDYLYRSPGLLYAGEKLGQSAMRAEACRGVSNFQTPPCGLPRYNPKQFELGGYSYEYDQPPSYYTITAEVGRAMQHVFGLTSLVTAAELVGGLWLVAALLVTYGLGRDLGVSRFALVGLLLFAASVPAVLYPSATVTNDAASLLVGAVCAWAVLRFSLSTRGRWWLLAVAGVLAAAFKATNLSILLLGVIFLLWSAATRSRGHLRAVGGRLPWPRALAGVVLLSLAWLVPTAAWNLRLRATAIVKPYVVDPGWHWYHAHRLPPVPLFHQVGRFFPPFWEAFRPPQLNNLPVHVATLVLAALLIAGTAHAALGLAPRLTGLARSLIPVALLGAPFFLVVYYVKASEVIRPIPARYGLALLPVMIVIAAGALKERWWPPLTFTCGLAGVGITAGALVVALH